MATLTVELNQEDIRQAIEQYIERKFPSTKFNVDSVIIELDSKGRPIKATVKPTDTSSSGYYDR